MMKKYLCVILSFLFIISVVIFPFKTEAATVEQLKTITSFKTTLNYKQYNALRTGTIGAEKKNGEWYYKFTTKNYYVLVKVSAFSSGVKNDYSSINKVLTTALNGGLPSGERSFIVKSFKTESRSSTYQGKTTKWNSYRTYMTNFAFSASISEADITMRCDRYANVNFTFNDKVKKTSSSSCKTYVSPTNATLYKRALTRDTKVFKYYAPSFHVKVDQAGKQKILLWTYEYKTVGKTKSNKIDVNKLIKVGYKTGSIVWNTTSKGLTIKTLYELTQLPNTIISGSGFQYTKTFSLSSSKYKGNPKVLDADFTSPVNLTAANDYFEVKLKLNKAPTFTGKDNTILSVTVSGDY